MVPKPSIFEPGGRATPSTIQKVAEKCRFFEDTNFDQKKRPKNHTPGPPATTTCGGAEIDPVPPLPQTHSPSA